MDYPSALFDGFQVEAFLQPICYTDTDYNT